MEIGKKFAATLSVCALLGAMSAPVAFAGETPPKPGDPKAKCNSGKGNGSETAPANDCDPGKSGGHNNGGD